MTDPVPVLTVGEFAGVVNHRLTDQLLLDFLTNLANATGNLDGPTRVGNMPQAVTLAVGGRPVALPPVLPTVTASTALTLERIQPVNATSAVTMTAVPALSGLTPGTRFGVRNLSTNKLSVPYSSGDTSATGKTSMDMTIPGTVLLEVVAAPVGMTSPPASGKYWTTSFHIHSDADLDAHFEAKVNRTGAAVGNAVALQTDGTLGFVDLAAGGAVTADSTGHIPASYMRQREQHWIALRRPNAKAETVSRGQGLAGIGSGGLTTGKPLLVSCFLLKGTVVSGITWLSNGNSSGVTHQWSGLYDSAFNLLAASADDTSGTAWAGGTEKTFAMATAYTVPADGLYYLGLCQTATSTNGLVGITGIGGPTALLTPMVVGLSPTTAAAPPTVGSSQITGTFTVYTGIPFAYVT